MVRRSAQHRKAAENGSAHDSSDRSSVILRRSPIKGEQGAINDNALVSDCDVVSEEGEKMMALSMLFPSIFIPQPIEKGAVEDVIQTIRIRFLTLISAGCFSQAEEVASNLPTQLAPIFRHGDSGQPPLLTERELELFELLRQDSIRWVRAVRVKMEI